MSSWTVRLPKTDLAATARRAANPSTSAASSPIPSHAGNPSGGSGAGIGGSGPADVAPEPEPAPADATPPAGPTMPPAPVFLVPSKNALLAAYPALETSPHLIAPSAVEPEELWPPEPDSPPSVNVDPVAFDVAPESVDVAPDVAPETPDVVPETVDFAPDVVPETVELPSETTDVPPSPVTEDVAPFRVSSTVETVPVIVPVGSSRDCARASVEATATAKADRAASARCRDLRRKPEGVRRRKSSSPLVTERCAREVPSSACG
jgi:hypothetical protein